MPSGAQVLAISSADFDGDGADDIAISTTRGAVQVLFGDGVGGFVPRPVPSFGLVPFAVGARDVNGDGRPDLLVFDQSGNALRVVPYVGNRNFGSPVSFPIGLRRWR